MIPQKCTPRFLDICVLQWYDSTNLQKGGETYMDIYIHADCVGKGNLHADFSREM